MSSSLKLRVTCLSSRRSLEDTSLSKVAIECLGNSSNSPVYDITVKKSKVTFKPVKINGQKGKKLKDLNFKAATEIFVSEKDKVLAFAVDKAKHPVCLALQFKEKSELERFKAMATKSNPNLEPPESESTSSSSDSQSSKSDDSVEIQHDKRRKSSPSSSKPDRSEKTEEPGESKKHDEEGVCKHCHQALPKKVTCSQVEYEPSIALAQSYYRSTTNSYDLSDNERRNRKRLILRDGGYYRTEPSRKIIYPQRKVDRHRQSNYNCRPRQRRRHSFSDTSDYKFHKPTYITDSTESSSGTSTTTAISEEEAKKIGKVTCMTPQFRRPRAHTMIVRRDDLKYRKPQQPTTYYIWNRNDEEEEDSFLDDSVSSYNDSESSVESLRSRRIRELLRELGKPGAVRLY
ncbi:unnamed protein product [Mesocestoides corti]|uniref:DUF5734 domain-containing protein n=1 Tax=Mesocestoides corti TaxID=53468 RepID=A0A0R3UG95_MESCO|nr:unnamed protein product [Mesocestoides corti]